MAIRLAHHLHAELVGVSPIRGSSSLIRTEERKQRQREKQAEAVTWCDEIADESGWKRHGRFAIRHVLLLVGPCE